ncbi:hypothetical protein HD598_000605 [Neomicrococcus aestuarii]|uniref:Uncharacterized protein n=2 Tax=Neomicrococcus aestuarii TaxID=556325 RepID=A0A7W8TTU5_9MICC|nr:hypothetical protein [Neomicrococcus aestuarii]
MMWSALVAFVLIAPISVPLIIKRYQESSKALVFGSAITILVLGAYAAIVGSIRIESAPIPGVIVAISGVLVSALGGGPITVAILRASHRVDLDQSEESAPAPAAATSATVNMPTSVPGAESISAVELKSLSEENTEHDPVLRGGLWIGLLERIAVTTTLLVGWPEGIAIVLGVKGLGRFKELGKEGAAERFILGTFASVLWACASYGIIQLLR